MTEFAESGCALLLVTHDEDLATAVTGHRFHLEPPTTPASESLRTRVEA